MHTTASRFFAALTLLALLLLGFNLYRGYQFEHAELDPAIKRQIDAKVDEVIERMRAHYGSVPEVHLSIEPSLPARLYGLAMLERSGRIRVMLNKKRLRESLDFVLDEVIAHEYAHAYMLYTGHQSTQEGHSSAWQEVCAAHLAACAANAMSISKT